MRQHHVMIAPAIYVLLRAVLHLDNAPEGAR